MSNTATHSSVSRPQFKKRVFFTGTTALKRGQGVCYDSDRGTATDGDGTRTNYVELPSTSNNRYFAGVCAESYDANAVGQYITIFEPGSKGVPVLTLTATTLNTGRLTCLVGTGIAGYFASIGGGGLPGRGSVRPAQTTPTASTTSADGPINSSIDGTALLTASTGSIGKTALFTNAVVGDLVVVMGGSTVGTGATKATRGVYPIVTKTDSDNAIVTGTICASNICVDVFVIRGYCTVECDLEDGFSGAAPGTGESGLAEFLDVTSGGTTALMVGGTTFIGGGVTIAADDVPPLVVGVEYGLTKAIECMGTLTTEDCLVTPTTSTALQVDHSTTLASLNFDAAAERTTLVWRGSKWQAVQNVGATQA